MKRIACMLGALVVLASGGCVTRRYIITSDPPGAIVFRDGQPIGATPVEEPFLYYGKYRFRLVKDGFQPLDVTPELEAPWYEYPGPDFVSENLIPYTFRDVKCLHYQLQPLESLPPDAIRARGEELRARGQAIQTPPGTEAAPKIRSPQAPPALPQPTPAREVINPRPPAVLPAPTPAGT